LTEKGSNPTFTTKLNSSRLKLEILAANTTLFYTSGAAMEKTRSPSLIHLRTLKRDTCVHFTRPFATQQHRSKPSSLQKYGVKCNSALEVHDVDELKQRLIDVWRHFEQSAIDDLVDQWRKCLCA